MNLALLGDREVMVMPNQGKFTLPVPAGYVHVLIPYTQQELNNRRRGNTAHCHQQLVREDRLAKPKRKGFAHG